LGVKPKAADLRIIEQPAIATLPRAQ